MRFLRMQTRGRASRLAAAPRARLWLEQLESRLVPYAVTGNAWPHPELVTISFMPDGTNLGGVVSNLFATLNATFGSPSVWQPQFLKAAQVWAQQTNLNFSLVSDSGATVGSGSYQQGDPTFGDIRIGGFNFGGPTLAEAFLPPPIDNYSVAGDIFMNTGQVFNIGSTYDLFTVAVHEMGHALGLSHSGTYNAVMYPAYTGVKPALASDDIGGIRNIYSANNARSPDGYNFGNYSIGTAADLTPWISPVTLMVAGGAMDITVPSQVEFFSGVAPAGTTGILTVQVQSKGLSLLAPSVYVYGPSINYLGSASGAGQYGTTLTVTVGGITAGSRYYFGVVGADASAFGTGRYGVVMNFGSYQTPMIGSPNTLTLNGSPLSGGGGMAEIPGHDHHEHGVGVDRFPDDDEDNVSAGPSAVDVSTTVNTHSGVFRLSLSREATYGSAAGAELGQMVASELFSVNVITPTPTPPKAETSAQETHLRSMRRHSCDACFADSSRIANWGDQEVATLALGV